MNYLTFITVFKNEVNLLFSRIISFRRIISLFAFRIISLLRNISLAGLVLPSTLLVWLSGRFSGLLI